MLSLSHPQSLPYFPEQQKRRAEKKASPTGNRTLVSRACYCKDDKRKLTDMLDRNCNYAIVKTYSWPLDHRGWHLWRHLWPILSLLYNMLPILSSCQVRIQEKSCLSRSHEQICLASQVIRHYSESKATHLALIFTFTSPSSRTLRTCP